MNSHILTLQRILEGVRAKQLQAVIIFIDFKKAFDSVHRGTLMKILLAYGIPKAIVDIIGLLYTNTKAQVITPDGMTSYFDVQAGVLQGDMLAPYLFIITVDYCIRQAIKSHLEYSFTVNPAKSKRIKADKISDLEFVDDITLMADSAEEAADLIRAVKRVLNNIGLNMNEWKKSIWLKTWSLDTFKVSLENTLEKLRTSTIWD